MRHQHPATYAELFQRKGPQRVEPLGFCTVVVSGTTGPLAPTLVDALIRDVSPYFAGGRPPATLKRLRQLHALTQSDKSAGIAPRQLVEVIVEVATHLQESGKAQGVLILIDELGKFLEFAAVRPEQSDIFLLQLLAEATATGLGPRLLLIGVLHQAFEQYATHLRPQQRQEWAKIQGRFEDISFQAPAEEFLDLLASAIVLSTNPAAGVLRKVARNLAEQAWQLGLAPTGLSRADFISRMESCAPLHPVVVLALARLCRKFGQNQRSLFSFLVAHEPYGFAEFLGQPFCTDNPPCYQIPHLFDYITANLGSTIMLGEAGARWAEAQNALDRARDCSPDEIKLLKAIGLLATLGNAGGLSASLPVLSLAVSIPHERLVELKESLASKSLVIERKYNNTLALWEGSDIDLDARLREAAVRVPPTSGIARHLNSLYPQKPIVAKRHSYRTGTLRYFEVRFTDISSFPAQLALPTDGDGILLYALPADRNEANELVNLALNSEVRGRTDILIAIPEDCSGLREAVRRLEELTWVRDNTPELSSDLVARRELRSMFSVAERELDSEVRRLFSPARLGSTATRWFHHGVQVRLEDARRLSAFISSLCDQVYSDSPVMRNELINRRVLSSAAAAARRNLIEAMILRGSEPNLGFAGYPPEVAIYHSILRETGLHRLGETGYEFGPPGENSSLHAVWKAMEDFLSSCELERRSVSELFSMLQSAPFGLKMGVLPILLCAASLHFDSEIAFYEEGTFVPEISVELFERLVRAPQNFHLRRYRIEGVKREVFTRMALALGTPARTDTQPDLVALVRPLFKFLHRLPQYTKQTRRLSADAIRVRECLFAARDPEDLVFRDLPAALGLPPFDERNHPAEAIDKFIRSWRAALLELQRAYDELIAEIHRLTIRAFGLGAGEARKILKYRASAVLEQCVDPRLKAFCHVLSRDSMTDAQWAEALGTLLAGKAPAAWNDTDRARFEVALTELVRAFRHLEAILFEKSRHARPAAEPVRIMRIGVTDEFSAEQEAVVVVDRRDRDLLASGIIQVRRALEALGLETHRDLALAILGTVVQDFLPSNGAVDEDQLTRGVSTNE
ncbi:MAG: hypothetical protein N3B12_04225 [Armatimonadetes bacterium]|nr:hypothetical protein [Armatimonadota bacterium]